MEIRHRDQSAGHRFSYSIGARTNLTGDPPHQASPHREAAPSDDIIIAEPPVATNTERATDRISSQRVEDGITFEN